MKSIKILPEFVGHFIDMKRKKGKNCGWMGKILRVDLTNNLFQEQSTFDYTEEFLGGKGINVKLLSDTVLPHVDPLAPENHIVFGTGPLTGTLAPGSCRTVVTARSPLTSLLGRSNFGGQWGPELKLAGYDHLDIFGAASQPVYLLITNEGTKIKLATHLWGKDAFSTKEAIKDELHDREVKVLTIGVAGENRVKYSSIISGETDFNAAGRTGMGAILGSKNVKAVAIKGRKGIAISELGKFVESCRQANVAIRNDPLYELFGNPVDFLVLLSSVGYYSEGNMEEVASPFDLADLKEFIEQYRVKRKGCYGCPLHCQVFIETPEYGKAGIQCQAFMEFAQHTKNFSGEFVWRSYLLAQKHGLDVMSTAATIAFAIDLFIHGIISEKDTDGLLLSWGKPEIVLELISKIAHREGIGDILAEGVKKAAQTIGQGAEEFAHTVRGLEMSGHELRVHPGMGFAFSVDERGDISGSVPLKEVLASLPSSGEEQHEQPSKSIDDEFRLEAQIYSENISDSSDVLGICKFLTPWHGMPVNEKVMTELFSLCTGVKLEVDELFAYAAKVRNLVRKMEIRWGGSDVKDILPKKVFAEPIAEGKFKGAKVNHKKLLNLIKNYYTFRGYDSNTILPIAKK